MDPQLGQYLADRRLRRVEDLCGTRDAADFQQQAQNPQVPKADVVFIHGFGSIDRDPRNCTCIPISNEVYSHIQLEPSASAGIGFGSIDAVQ
jgi:hypothetical protein